MGKTRSTGGSVDETRTFIDLTALEDSLGRAVGSRLRHTSDKITRHVGRQAHGGEVARACRSRLRSRRPARGSQPIANQRFQGPTIAPWARQGRRINMGGACRWGRDPGARTAAPQSEASMSRGQACALGVSVARPLAAPHGRSRASHRPLRPSLVNTAPAARILGPPGING